MQIIYEYAPSPFSQEKLNKVYGMLFDEIKELLIVKSTQKLNGEKTQ